MSASELFPVEIWLRIFRLLIHIEHLPVKNATLVEDLRLFSVSMFVEPRFIICNVERTNISLVCRYFYDILKEHGAKVAVVNQRGEVEKFAYYATHEVRRLEAGSVPLASLERRHQSFPALEVLVGYWPYQDLESFLDHTPNLRVLSIHVPNDASTHSISILHHPVAQHLTHLSIYLGITSSAQRVTMPSLKFLHLTFTASHYTLPAGLPWRFPSLRSLYISGDFLEMTFEAFTPFLTAHSATVTRLYDDFRVWRPSSTISSIEYFNNLDVYAVSLAGRSDDLKPPPSIPITSLRPLTLLWMHAPLFIANSKCGGADMRIVQLKRGLVILGYWVHRIVLDRTWDGLRRYHEHSKLQLSYPLFLHELKRIDAPGCPIFDRHLVRFRPIDW